MKSLSNNWYNLLKSNSHIDVISEQLDDFQEFVLIENHYDNVFIFDGTVPIVVDRILDVLLSNDTMKIPTDIKKDSNTIIGWYEEPECYDYVFDAVHKVIDLFKLKTENVFFINCVPIAKDKYQKYLEKNKIKNPIKNFLLSDFWIKNKEIYQFPDEVLNEKNIESKKLYVSPNLTPRIHRLALIPLLNYYDLLDHGYVSSVSVESCDFEYDKEIDTKNHLFWCKKIFRHDEEINHILEKFQTRIPLPLKIDDRQSFGIPTLNVWLTKDTKKDFYEACINSLFFLVTEVLFDETGFCGTEKTFMPVYFEKPFLLIGPYNHLLELRKKGFKTFSPYINEQYDEIKDPAQRLKSVVKELQRLQKLRELDPDKFYDIYNEMKKITKFNKQLFLNNL